MSNLTATQLEQLPTQDLAKCVTLACLWEATAPKPGNVHRGADFSDTTFADYVTSAAVVGPIVGRATELGVGATVLEAVRATHQVIGKNTNLGTLLLLVPLAAVPAEQPLDTGISGVLDNLTEDDTRLVYQAIRESRAGGLSRVEYADIWDIPPRKPLVEIMRLAAERDLIARQYANGFRKVFDSAAAWLLEGMELGFCVSDAIVHTQLRLLAAFPDSLIQRKCGVDAARETSDRAAAILALGGPGEEAYDRALGDLDFWLRADGHRRNPGTTADLIAAGLFVILREGRVNWPVVFHRALQEE